MSYSWQNTGKKTEVSISIKSTVCASTALLVLAWTSNCCESDVRTRTRVAAGERWGLQREVSLWEHVHVSNVDILSWHGSQIWSLEAHGLYYHSSSDADSQGHQGASHGADWEAPCKPGSDRTVEQDLPDISVHPRSSSTQTLLAFVKWSIFRNTENSHLPLSSFIYDTCGTDDLKRVSQHHV